MKIAISFFIVSFSLSFLLFGSVEDLYKEALVAFSIEENYRKAFDLLEIIINEMPEPKEGYYPRFYFAYSCLKIYNDKKNSIYLTKLQDYINNYYKNELEFIKDLSDHAKFYEEYKKVERIAFLFTSYEEAKNLFSKGENDLALKKFLEIEALSSDQSLISGMDPKFNPFYFISQIYLRKQEVMNACNYYSKAMSFSKLKDGYNEDFEKNISKLCGSKGKEESIFKNYSSKSNLIKVFLLVAGLNFNPLKDTIIFNEFDKGNFWEYKKTIEICELKEGSYFYLLLTPTFHTFSIKRGDISLIDLTVDLTKVKTKENFMVWNQMIENLKFVDLGPFNCEKLYGKSTMIYNDKKPKIFCLGYVPEFKNEVLEFYVKESQLKTKNYCFRIPVETKEEDSVLLWFTKMD